MGERFIGLTVPDGELVWVGVSWVQVVRLALPREAAVGAVSVLELSGRELAVRETPDQVYDVLCAVPPSYSF